MDCFKWILVINLHLLLLSCRGLQGQGLFMSNRGTPIDNDGFVHAGNIYNGFNPDNESLLCITNATNCCGGDNRTGDWFYPNGSIVDSFTNSISSVRYDFFARNRGQNVVRLYRRGNPSERGRFSCELLGDTIYVNILNIGPVSISPSTPVTVTAGQTFNLQCSVVITPHPLPENTSAPEIEWLFGQASSICATTSNGSIYSSTLQLTSVSESDEGMYTCRLRGNHRTAVNTTVTVEPAPIISPPGICITPPTPMLSVSISPSGTNTAGETYRLLCSATVTGSTDTPTITWLGDGVEITTDSSRTVSATTSDGSNGYSSTLTFSPLSASHAGTYTCRATVDGGMQTNSLVSDQDQEVVHVTVQVDHEDDEMTTDKISTKCSCSTEIGTTVTVILVIIIICLAVTLVVVIVLLFLEKRKKVATKGDFAVSANVAYGEVKLEDSGAVYEDLDKVARSVEGNYQLTEHPASYGFQPAAPVCAATESTKPSLTSEQQQKQAPK